MHTRLLPHGPGRRAAHLLLALGVGAGLIAGGPAPFPAFAQTPPPGAAVPATQLLTQGQLEALLAPIALYPDDLLMQVLMASTYPLEIVQAVTGGTIALQLASGLPQ